MFFDRVATYLVVRAGQSCRREGLEIFTASSILPELTSRFAPGGCVYPAFTRLLTLGGVWYKYYLLLKYY